MHLQYLLGGAGRAGFGSGAALPLRFYFLPVLHALLCLERFHSVWN